VTSSPSDKEISLSAIPGVTTPVFGATPITTITDTDQYTGTVVWNGSPATFATSTVYTATITLTAKTGYTLIGVAADFFTVAGATSDTNPMNSGVVTAVFPATGTPATVINIAAIPGVTAPATGASPVTAITETAQYTGTVSWSPSVGDMFVSNTNYTATITLKAKAGYTLTGISADFFIVAGTSSDTNPVNSGVVTVVFPATLLFPMTMINVPGGTFYNGTANITVSSFRMSQHEITGEQYAAVTGVSDPSFFASISNNPVEQVSWYDAVEFCNKLSSNDGLTSVYTITNRTPATGYPITTATVSSNSSANGYRLPTEMEWMWAAMGATADRSNGYTGTGTNTTGFNKNFSGSTGSNTRYDYTWYMDNASGTTHTVSGKIKNELGLYDMSGNVWEWCWDLIDLYSGSSNHIIHGGGWDSSFQHCTVKFQSFHRSDYQSNSTGFRVVCP
jgi:formylglycine-generating enzyme required for sulfatase activity